MRKIEACSFRLARPRSRGAAAITYRFTLARAGRSDANGRRQGSVRAFWGPVSRVYNIPVGIASVIIALGFTGPPGCPDGGTHRMGRRCRRRTFATRSNYSRRKVDPPGWRVRGSIVKSSTCRLLSFVSSSVRMSFFVFDEGATVRRPDGKPGRGCGLYEEGIRRNLFDPEERRGFARPCPC